MVWIDSVAAAAFEASKEDAKGAAALTVHAGPAAVHGLRPLPATRGVVGVVAEPGHVAREDRERAKAPSAGGGVQRLEARHEARLEDAAQLHAGLVAGVDHGVAALQRDLERLVAQDVDLPLRAGQGRLEVES